jgi:uncharacterized protein (TIGR00106 family)
MLAEFSIVPLGEGEHLGELVAKAVRIVDESGLDYRVHGMGTEIEGSWDEVMAVIRRCHEAVAGQSARVYTIIKIDDRKGHTGAIESKVKSVEEKIGKPIRK